MPGQFFSNAERERLQRFPSKVALADLIAFFTLSESDLAQLLSLRIKDLGLERGILFLLVAAFIQCIITFFMMDSVCLGACSTSRLGNTAASPQGNANTLLRWQARFLFSISAFHRTTRLGHILLGR